MSTAGYIVTVVAVWVLSGIVAVAVFIARRGHRAWYWYPLGAVLGLLFIPIAMERGSRPTGRLETTPVPAAGTGPSAPGAGPRVLVGLDGSADSEHALRTAHRVLAGRVGELILTTVVDVAAVERGERTAEETDQLDRARELLTDRAARLRHAAGPPLPSSIEIVTGRPARALLDVAQARDVDMIVVGRRGRGLSNRLLGSVADQVVRDATRPVLLAASEDG
ncbi:nucleotide-binding universal stress UspA family protein [Micromonospora sp. Llam0]|uniref:universal stress protein n=1 Tax=Micromonospora sp. Llam0 TaxID=2485143 RepID=UPI000F46616E|nr:universal stress protein [Micromonospora sp. Llam0]ROO61288.1 nucleotide-binding universal stress UspA family protein [Micromonospora sp. Llam0]